MKDRISEFYKGEFGPTAMKKQKKRINWILQNIKSGNVLDVGCSQGIISILVGREGNKVIGLDISEDAISYGKRDLAMESESTRELVTFIKEDFLMWDSSILFDTIIITEVLEHYHNSYDILKKAFSLLKSNGKIIITVPFGINPFPDHKRTIYLYELYEELYPFFSITEVKFIENWTGITGEKNKLIKKNVKDIHIPAEVIKKGEKHFYKIEQRHLSNIKRLKEEIEKLKTEGGHSCEKKQ